MRDQPAAGRALRWVLLVAAAGLAAPSLQAQLPDKFTNLQVLPKDITKPQLIGTMRSFAGGLGVRCDFCHQEGADHKLDFASDAKEQKKTARLMMKMVAAINGDYLTKLGGEHAEHSHENQVGCFTCHHGVQEPDTIQTVLDEEIDKTGVDAAVAKYRELKERYYGRASYDFGAPPLDDLAEHLLEEKKTAEAMRILELNLESYPDVAETHALMGEAYLATGDREKARTALEKAIELDPKNPRLKKRLEEISKPTP
jgi:tetratricopeptide (TPR) repeat protein